MIGYFSNPENVWIWNLVQSSLVLLGFLLVLRQLRSAREQNSISHLNFFRDLWISRSLLRARLAVVQNSDGSVGDFEGYEDVLATFLEDLSAAARIGQLNKAHLWSYYSYYIEGYWLLLKPKIIQYRNKISDPTYFAGFEKLYYVMCKVSETHGSSPMPTSYVEQFRIEEARVLRFLLR